LASPFLTLTDLDKRFGELHVIRSISVTVDRGEILALLGPSGSGKTTLLRLLAGFETPDAGEIRVDGEDVARQPPARRRFGMVFQHYALFPHLTVGENVAFGLDHLVPSERSRRVTEMLTLVDLPGFEARRPGEISGGQQQRVALARALAPEPRALLLDEPLSNLDPSLRERTRREIQRTIRRVGITTVLVTHEQEEAFDLGDRVAVLHEGELDQVGVPEELYREPATRFVATFIGRASVLPGRVVDGGVGGETGAVELEGFAAAGPWRGVLAEDLRDGERAHLIVRPETLAFVPPGSDGALPGRVAERRYAGPVSYYAVELSPTAGSEVPEETVVEVVVEVLAAADAASEGDRVTVAIRGDGPPPRIFAAGEHGTERGTGAETGAETDPGRAAP
jgi:ABC-type Fe3+/spermidine/putrescine transport system ATPase subunit